MLRANACAAHTPPPGIADMQILAGLYNRVFSATGWPQTQMYWVRFGLRRKRLKKRANVEGNYFARRLN